MASLIMYLTGMALVAGLVQARECRNIPGDQGWPTQADWTKLNKTVGGRLIQTVPMASVCHMAGDAFNAFNQTQCAALQGEWYTPQNFIDDPVELMTGYFQTSCDPFESANSSCALGNRPLYSIAVSGANDVIAGLNFVKAHNIRLTIKNTGHDFLGKSTGFGALNLWTHKLQGTEIIDKYKGSYRGYSGPAAKIGAGVVAGEALIAAAAKGYRVIGGSCPSVGIAGGYTAGAGHGLLNSKYGMAADAVLEWEVVTPEGKHVVATPNQNSDLYWALSGGGGGTYGIVLSMTTKVFPDGIVGGGKLVFDSSQVGNATFWAAIGDYFAFLPSYLDKGNTITWVINSTTFETETITVPDRNAQAVQTYFQPFLDQLTGRGIAYQFITRTDATYFDHYNTDLGPVPYGPWPSTVQLSTRLIPRAGVLDPTQNANIVAAIQATTDFGFYEFGCHAISVHNITHPENSVFPGWRDAVAVCLVTSFWDYGISEAAMAQNKDHLVDVIIPTLEKATPGAGSYLNEMDARYKGDWKTEFYGVNYDRLMGIKNKYDPHHLLYGPTAVGSDLWVSDNAGRLCQSGNYIHTKTQRTTSR